MPTKVNWLELEKAIQRAPKPVCMAIAGGTCAGKSFLTQQIKGYYRLEGRSVFYAQQLPLDAFFRDIEDPLLPHNQLGQAIFDLPSSYHGRDFIQAAATLMGGKKIPLPEHRSVLIPEYDLESNRVLPKPRWGKLVYTPFGVLLAEGIYTIMFLCKQPYSLIKVYVETLEEVMLQRRIARDTKVLGVPVAAVRRVFTEKILPYHQQWVVRQKQWANYIIDGQGGE